MNDYMLEEMAETIAKELSVDHKDVLPILHRYWADKIAPVWQVARTGNQSEHVHDRHKNKCAFESLQ